MDTRSWIAEKLTLFDCGSIPEGVVYTKGFGAL